MDNASLEASVNEFEIYQIICKYVFPVNCPLHTRVIVLQARVTSHSSQFSEFGTPMFGGLQLYRNEQKCQETSIRVLKIY